MNSSIFMMNMFPLSMLTNYIGIQEKSVLSLVIILILLTLCCLNLLIIFISKIYKIFKYKNKNYFN
jgi:hypothetical protein